MKKKLTLMLALVTMTLVPFFSWSQSVNAQASGLTVEDVQEKGTLIVGTSADYPPFEFHTQIDGKDQIIGLDISFAEYLAEDLGVELEIIDIGFDAILPALETGTIDVGIAGFHPTPERKKSVDFSDHYYSDDVSIVVRAEDEEKYQTYEDIIGESIGAQTGSIQLTFAEAVPEAEVMKLQDIPQLLLALKTKKINAVILTHSTAAAYIANDPSIHLYVDEFPDNTAEGMAVAFRKGSEDLIERTNNVIAEAQEQELVEEWLAEASQHMDLGDADAEEQNFLVRYWPYFSEGIKNTIIISVVGVFFGLILGTILALMRMSNSKVFSALATAYIEFLRGTPMLIQVMFIYFGLGYLISIPALTSGIIAVSLNSGAYVAEIIRSGLGSVDPGQTEAARSLALNQRQSLQHVVFPQALKNIWPALGNEFITIIKESSIVSTIGVAELTFQTNIVQSTSYKGILPLFIAMVFYFILTFSLTKLLNYMEKRMEYK